MGTNLGNKIKEAREDAGKTQSELAEAIGVGQGAISSWEVGRTNPSPSAIKRMSAYLSLSTTYFMGDSKNPFNTDLNKSDKKDFTVIELSTEEEELIKELREAKLIDRIQAYAAALSVLHKEGTKD